MQLTSFRYTTLLLENSLFTPSMTPIFSEKPIVRNLGLIGKTERHIIWNAFAYEKSDYISFLQRNFSIQVRVHVQNEPLYPISTKKIHKPYIALKLHIFTCLKEPLLGNLPYFWLLALLAIISIELI